MLIDPPFEQSDEFSRLAHAIVNAWRKWATGVYLLWYPIKDRRAAAAFTRALTTSAMPKILRAELELDAGRTELGAAGLIIVNPPWRLDEELNVLLSSLARLLARGADGGCRVDWLRGET